MCLNTFFSKKLIADKDMTVYKIGTCFNDNIFKPMYFEDFKYEKDVPTEEIDFKINYCFDHYEVEEGYHSYFNKDYVKERFKRYFSNDYDIGEFIIPKGAEYRFGNKGDVVSSKLIYKGIYKRRKRN